jgi:hypothetical protein
VEKLMNGWDDVTEQT